VGKLLAQSLVVDDVHRGQAGPPSQRLDFADDGPQPRSVPAPQGQVVTFLREHHRDSPVDLARRSDDQSLPDLTPSAWQNSSCTGQRGFATGTYSSSCRPHLHAASAGSTVPVMIRSGVFATRLENIDWQQTHPDGTKSATLVGSREPGVTFTYAFFIPAGIWDAPHSHIAAAHLVVASGELRLGYGTQLDRQAADPFPVGSFLYVPAGAVHFDGAEQDSVLLGTAVGPWSTDYVNS